MDISKQALRSTMDQRPPARFASFVDIVRWQSERIGHWDAFRFLEPASGGDAMLDYATLDWRIRSVAAELRAAGRPGQRVLIVQQPGLEYIVSLFGCLYAGMVAVPVYPVDLFRLRQTLPRLQAITRDADAAIMLTSSEAMGIRHGDGASHGGGLGRGGEAICDGGADALGPLWKLCDQAVIFTDKVDPAAGHDYRAPAIGGHDLAILQYTSGTTASPRGVALQHRQLIANARQIYDAYHVPDAVCVFWLPPYHDMGLVGGLLLPMFAGRSSVLMSPTSFVQNPIAWLRAISDYQGTTTASPNFGYELCLRKIKEADWETLDLSSLQVAISGAEPIRAATLQQFAGRYAACGLRSSALTPAYGMAEATLAITGKPLAREPRTGVFLAASLHGSTPTAVPASPATMRATGRAAGGGGDWNGGVGSRAVGLGGPSGGEHEEVVEIVSCGVPLAGTAVHVVDPETRRILPEGQIGEIWVSGPSVAGGYWRNRQRSREVFHASIADAFTHPAVSRRIDSAGDYLRTGDLGFFYQNELYVSGRLKDLIIIAGKNYFAHELESAIQGSHEAFKVDGGLAFGCVADDSGEEQLVIVQEVLRPKRFDLDELVQSIRTTLAQQYDLYPAAVVLLPAATLNKTSSGKLQRGDCAARFLAGQFEPLCHWTRRALSVAEQPSVAEQQTVAERHPGAANDLADSDPGTGGRANGTAMPVNGAATPMNGAANPVNGAATTVNGAANPVNGAATTVPASGDSAERTVEDQLMAIWADVLMLKQADPDQHFLDVGGHSLAALALLSQIRERFGVVVDIETLFQSPRLADFCNAVRRQVVQAGGDLAGRAQDHTPDRNAASASVPPGGQPNGLSLTDHGGLSLTDHGGLSLTDRDGLPLTETQHRFWVLHQLEQQQAFLHVELTLHLTGSLDRDVLARAIAQLPDRHEALRSQFIVDERGEIRQRFADDASLAAEWVDCCDLSLDSAEGRQQVEQLRRSLIQQPFSIPLGNAADARLAAAPLLRVAVLSFAQRRTQIVLVGHHLVCDASSLAVIARDLAAGYQRILEQSSRPTDGGGNDGAGVGDDVGSVVSRRQRLSDGWSQWLSLPGLASSSVPNRSTGSNARYWLDRLQGYCGQVRLALPPVERPAGEDAGGVAGRPPSASQRLRLSPATVRTLKQRCRQWRVTGFETLLAAWHEYLSRHTEEPDIVLGVPVADRGDAVGQDCVGCLIDLLPIRLKPVSATAELVSGDSAASDTLADRVAAVSRQWRSDWRQAPAPLEVLTAAIGRNGDKDRLPLIQNLFLYQPPISGALVMGDARCEHFSSDYSTLGAYDTALVVQWHDASSGAASDGSGVECDLTLAYSPQALSSETARRLIDRFAAWLDRTLERPAEPLIQQPAWDESGQQLLNKTCAAEQWHRRQPTVLELFTAQVQRSADAPVAIDGEGTLTFAQLDRDSARLAQRLTGRGVGRGDIVAMQLPRGRQLLVAAVAVWKAGAAYLPLDPAYPSQRLQDVLADARPQCVLTDQLYRELMSGRGLEPIADSSFVQPADDVDPPAESANGAAFPQVTADDLAYLIYTSGSTGKPKGVALGHDNLANVLLAFADGKGVTAGTRILAATTISFDISVLELFLPLVTGATAVISPSSLSSDADAVIRWMQLHAVDVVQATPSSLRLLQAAGWQPDSGQTVWCGGEALQVDLARWLVRSGCQLWNVYGPTETTVWSLACRIDERSLQQSSWISIGQPIDSTTLRIVLPGGGDAPIGVPGELWIGGHGVGRGYWQQPQLTAERFVSCPAPEHCQPPVEWEGQRSGGPAPSPLAAATPVRMYRTGDLVRLHDDGRLEFLGRSDRQVKLRGHRIELGEIEAAMQQCDAVAESAVVLAETPQGDQRLLAFYRPVAGAGLDAAAEVGGADGLVREHCGADDVAKGLQAQLASRLPDSMVPRHWYPLAEIPKTPAGKIDYRALPIDAALSSDAVGQDCHGNDRPAAGDGDGGGVVAGTPQERLLIEVWQELLGRPVTGVDESFFDLGGHSLLAAQMLARVRARTGIQLPLRQIYDHPTVATLAVCLTDASERLPAVAAINNPVDPCRQQQAIDSFLAASGDGQQHLSSAEQRLWFVDQLEPEHPFYNLPLAARLDGPLDHEHFWNSIDDCIQRHETLRSTYRLVDGKPVCQVQPSLEVTRHTIDLTGQADASSVYEQQMLREARRPFDLEHGPLLRVVLWRLGAEQHVVLLVMHHIISDGWSMAVMMRELSEFYQARRDGRRVNQTPLPVSYRQYANWQQQQLADPAMKESLEFWRQQLQDAPETIDLPTDYPRPAQQDFEGAIMPLSLNADLTSRISELARRTQTSVFSVLLAAYGWWLARLSGQRDLTVGTAVANRNEPLVEGLIGFFVNTLVLRQQVDDTSSFRRWVSQVHANGLQSLEHQRVPFEQVVEALARQRDRSHSPLFQTAFVLQNAPDPLRTVETLTLEPLAVDNGTSKYDLTLFLSERDGCLSGHFEYRTSLFTDRTMAALADSFQTFLQAAVDDAQAEGDSPQATALMQLPMVSPQQVDELRARGDGGPPLLDLDHRQDGQISADVWQQIQATAAATPQAIAIRHGQQQLTFAELVARARTLGTALGHCGVAAGDQVIVYLPRSIDQVVTLLAIWQAGAAFVPIDPDVPTSRLQQIQQELGGVLVVVEPARQQQLGQQLGPDIRCLTLEQICQANDGASNDSRTSNARSVGDGGSNPGSSGAASRGWKSSLAYLIFTSGSTGTPKGVAVRHHPLLNFIRCYIATLAIRAGMRCSYLFSPSFDGAIAEVLPPLVAGATIEVIDHEVSRDPQRLTQALVAGQVDTVAISPAMLAELDPQALSGVTCILSAGAPLSAEQVARWLPTHRLFNGYGPTETTVGVCIAAMDSTDLAAPSVGRPLPGTRVYLLDDQQRWVADGVIGEVYIAGAGVADGYWNHPDWTQRSFLIDLEGGDSSSRMYRTGDLGRWNQHGKLEIVGRADDQIQLRGYRIEPGEIAAALDQLPGVAQSAVVAWQHDSADSPRLVAYVVPDAEAGSRDESSLETISRGEQAHIEHWRDLFEASQHSQGVVFDPADDFSGWSSVITGRPIPLEQMRAWADATAQRILQLKPKRVLEIGCGTGLILLRIGEQIERYHGIDVLPSAIERLRNTLQSRPQLQSKVTLHCAAADQLDDEQLGFGDGQFDTIVLNSVAQYFPSGDYLQRVLRAAERLVAPGGKIFLGDLRNLCLQRPFAIAAERERLRDDGMTIGQFKQLVQNRIDHEEELLVDPHALATQLALPRLASTTLSLKTAAGDNELTRFRYDAVLWLDTADTTGQPAGFAPADDLAAFHRHVSREIAIARQLDAADDDQPAAELLAAPAADSGHMYTNEVMQHAALTNEPLARRQSADRIARWRQQLQQRLPAYMVPAAFVLIDRLPLTLQGKLDRAALPQPALSRHGTGVPLAAAQTETEQMLVALWEELLEISPIGIDDDFFHLGGHSMLAVRLASRIEQVSGRRMPLSALFRQPTIRDLAAAWDQSQDASASLLVPLSVPPAGSRVAATLFCIHPAGGTVFCYRDLALRLGDNVAVWGVQARGLDGQNPPHHSLAEMASDYAEAIMGAAPEGDLNLCGWSLGGNIAYEVARELVQRGRHVSLLALLDSGRLAGEQALSEDDFLPLIAALFPGDQAQPLEHLRSLSAEQQLDYFVQRAAQAGIVPDETASLSPHIFDVFQANIQAVHQHRPVAADVDILLVRPRDQAKTGQLFDDPTLGWSALANSVETTSVPGDHAHLLQGAAANQIARLLQQRLVGSPHCSAG